MSLNRTLAGLIDTSGDVKSTSLDNVPPSGLDSAQVLSIAGGLTVYATLDDLPTSGLTSGDQAYITSTNRIYVSNGSGWYNVALINATPSLSIDPTGSVTLAIDGSTPTVITLTGTDSDNADANLIYSAESDGNFGGLATLSQDSSVFTITPLGEDSATTETSTLTFKVSDGVSFGSGTTTFTLTFVTIVDNSAETTMLLKADTTETDNQVDASTNNNTITENGNVTSTAFSPYHPGGYSIAFAGSDDYIGFDNGYIATNGTWWNSSGFTLELWFYKTVSTGVTGTVFDNRQSSTSGFLLTNKNTGWDMYLNGAYLFQDVGTEKVGQWVHLALVASGTTVTLYENGISLYTTGSAPNTSSYAYFGRSQNTVGAVQYTPRGTNVDWPGYMYDIRISSGSRYTTAFTPSETPHENDSNTILLACSSPMLKDKSSNNHEITVFGDGISTARFTPHDYDPYTKAEFGGSVYFDGTDDYLTVTNDISLNVGTGDFTLEAWFYLNADDGSYNICSQYASGNTGGMWLGKYSNGFVFRRGGVADVITASFSPSVGAWHHVAVSRATGSTKLFIDGTQTGSTVSSDTNNYGVTAPFYIGSDNAAPSSGYMNGYISDFRLIKGTGVYTSNFTPPTAPLTAIANTQLLTCTNKNDIWNAGSGNVLTKAGNVTSSNTQRKFISSSAVYLDGVSDSISFTAGYDDPLYNFGAHDWTLEGWFYIQTLTGGKNLFSFLRAGTNEAVPHIYTSNTDLRYYVSATDRINGTGALTVNTWHHIAVTRSGNDHKLFVDGTQVGSTWTNGQTYVQGRPVLGDYHSSLNTLTNAQTTHGYVQDLRVTKGLARYTANFTPPTAEFEG